MRRWLAGVALLIFVFVFSAGITDPDLCGSLPASLFRGAAAEETENAGSTPNPSEPVSHTLSGEEEPAGPVQLQLKPVTGMAFTNVVAHYVCFRAITVNAAKVSVRVYNPKGKQTDFRTKQLATLRRKAVRTDTHTLKSEENGTAELDVLFPSGSATGTWIIRVTAEAKNRETAEAEIPVVIREKDPLVLNDLAEIRSMVTGYDSSESLPVEAGKIRYVSQNIRDPFFVKEYWFSKGHDLRETARVMCTRAVFSMALSYLGIDCTPVKMSDMLMAETIFYTYDDVCEMLGGVERKEGDLETLWAEYGQGKASPVMLHFNYTYEGYDGMHALLLIARDPNVPELFYALAPGQKVNTSRYAEGMKEDPIIPILIDQGEVGYWIQSPLLPKYHKGRIDEIWNWRTN